MNVLSEIRNLCYLLKTEDDCIETCQNLTDLFISIEDESSPVIQNYLQESLEDSLTLRSDGDLARVTLSALFLLKQILRQSEISAGDISVYLLPFSKILYFIEILMYYTTGLKNIDFLLDLFCGKNLIESKEYVREWEVGPQTDIIQNWFGFLEIGSDIEDLAYGPPYSGYIPSRSPDSFKLEKDFSLKKELSLKKKADQNSFFNNLLYKGLFVRKMGYRGLRVFFDNLREQTVRELSKYSMICDSRRSLGGELTQDYFEYIEGKYYILSLNNSPRPASRSEVDSYLVGNRNLSKQDLEIFRMCSISKEDFLQ